MNRSRSSKQQSRVALANILKAAGIGIISSAIFGFAFSTGVQVEKRTAG